MENPNSGEEQYLKNSKSGADRLRLTYLHSSSAHQLHLRA